MKRNPTLAKMAAMKDAERKAVITRTVVTMEQAMCVALNRRFGFGPDRNKQALEELTAVINEYGVLLGTDAEYADAKLEEAAGRCL